MVHTYLKATHRAVPLLHQRFNSCIQPVIQLTTCLEPNHQRPAASMLLCTSGHIKGDAAITKATRTLLMGTSTVAHLQLIQ